MYSALCGNTRVRDSERLLLQTFTNSFEYIVRRDGEITVVECGGEGGE